MMTMERNRNRKESVAETFQHLWLPAPGRSRMKRWNRLQEGSLDITH